MVKRKFSFDGGHSEKDTPGKQDPEGRKEWWYNDKIVRYAMALLEEYEDVETKRFDDPTGKTDIPLETRTANINKWGSDFHTSVHLNAYGSGGWSSPGGTEVYVYGFQFKEAAAVAKQMQANLVKELGFANRGVKEANFHMVRETAMPAALPEIAFMTNKTEAYKMRTAEYQKKAAKAIVDALATYYKLKKKPAPKPQPKPATGKLYKVQIGAFGVKANAERLAKDAEAKGFKTFIVEE